MDNGNTQNFDLDQFNLDTTNEKWDDKTSSTTNEAQDSANNHDQRAIGNIAITTPENDSDIAQQPDQELNDQAVPISLPPDQPVNPQEGGQQSQPAPDDHLAHTVQKALNGEKITQNDVKDIESAINSMEIADLYETIRPEPKGENN